MKEVLIFILTLINQHSIAYEYLYDMFGLPRSFIERMSVKCNIWYVVYVVRPLNCLKEIETADDIVDIPT